VSNRQSLIAAIIPAEAATTGTLFCLRSRVPIEQQHFLCALLNSYVLNALVRMLMGGHLTTTLIESLPVPRWAARPPSAESHGSRAGCRRRLVGKESRRGFRRPSPLMRTHAGSLPRHPLGFPLVPALDRRRALIAFDRRYRRSHDGGDVSSPAAHTQS
jgi:hypothetical protein